MANTFLEAFVKEALARGESRERIGAALASAGWTAKEIDAALSAWILSDLGIPAPKPKPYVSAREAFLYLVFFVLLGVVAWHLGALLFALIDKAFPDILDRGYVVEQIRSGLSGLIVGAPIFVWLGVYIVGQRQKNAAMQRSRVRKWLTYVTLVAAACTLVGDAIALVHSFLSGDLSTRLLLKLLVVAGISGAIFLYFIREAERGDDNDRQA